MFQFDFFPSDIELDRVYLFIHRIKMKYKLNNSFANFERLIRFKNVLLTLECPKNHVNKLN